MYLCICQAVTESEIDAAIDAGARSVDALRERLAAASCCGACVAPIEEKLQGLSGVMHVLPAAAATSLSS